MGKGGRRGWEKGGGLVRKVVGREERGEVELWERGSMEGGKI